MCIRDSHRAVQWSARGGTMRRAEGREMRLILEYYIESMNTEYMDMVSTRYIAIGSYVYVSYAISKYEA